jgi:hypothetical protein
VKFQFTKILIEKKDIWRGLTEYMRTMALCKERLIRFPEDSVMLRMRGDLEQMILVRIKVENEMK